MCSCEANSFGIIQWEASFLGNQCLPTHNILYIVRKVYTLLVMIRFNNRGFVLPTDLNMILKRNVFLLGWFHLEIAECFMRKAFQALRTIRKTMSPSYISISSICSLPMILKLLVVGTPGYNYIFRGVTGCNALTNFSDELLEGLLPYMALTTASIDK